MTLPWLMLSYVGSLLLVVKVTLPCEPKLPVIVFALLSVNLNVAAFISATVMPVAADALWGDVFKIKPTVNNASASVPKIFFNVFILVSLLGLTIP